MIPAPLLLVIFLGGKASPPRPRGEGHADQTPKNLGALGLAREETIRVGYGGGGDIQRKSLSRIPVQNECTAIEVMEEGMQPPDHPQNWPNGPVPSSLSIPILYSALHLQ